MSLFPWTAKDVTRALGFPEASWDHAYAGVSTDTRTMGEGDLFIALQGERFDGHAFLGDARLAGVGGVVVRHGTPRWPGFDWFEVDDTREALGRLARWRRDRFTGPVVAITGTNGKTSTKELAAAALGARLAVHKSARNLNNLVGVPQTVLAAPQEAQAMVVECGASERGEIAKLREIVRPDVAVVTNVDAGHLEGFGSLDAVLEEKSSLLQGAPVAIVGCRPTALPEAARKAARRVVTVSIEGPSDWKADGVTMLPDGRPRFAVRGHEVTLPLRGRHMVGNALLALAVADAAGVPLADAAGGLAGVTLPGGRSDVLEAGGCTIINDSYNANPQSLAAALDLLTDLRGTRRAVVVLGSMLELGPESAALHRAAAEAVLRTGPEVIAAVGAFVPAFAEAGAGRATLVTGATAADVVPPLRDLVKEGDVVLLKGSRGMRLETVLDALWPGAAAGGAH
jgi:UDP-N-acetylmuramoyl-tripeptide--D-alanyl-D-alanine ligase